MAGLFDALKQYIADALPGGSLNPEQQPVAERANYLSGLLDPNSQVSQDARNWHGRVQTGLMDQLAGRDTLEAEHAYQTMMQAASIAPFGILKRADLKRGGSEFGQWQLQNVERRLIPEEYVDSLGNDRVRYVADMGNAEQSWGSGQPIANIYWMKDKRTGEIKPFGDDTAHYAMGNDTSSFAKKKFAEELSKQRNDWFKAQREGLGMKWHEGGPSFERIRELLLTEKINEEKALQMMIESKANNFK